jgi:integrase
MTTRTTFLNTPTRIFERKELNVELETLRNLERFEADQKNNGRAPETVQSRMQALKQVARLCDLTNPEEVKVWLTGDERTPEEQRCKWSNKTKVKFCDTYSAYLKFLRIEWTAPSYQVAERHPFIPTEQEIDQLIAGCGKQTATALQTLKEDALRIGELCQLKWKDLDTERRLLSITPEKGSNPRILPISDKLLGMLNSLPHNHGDNIFQPKKRMLREYFSLQRKRVAEKLQNPRIKLISFHTLRHWKGTMLYAELRDLREVQKFLGHKSILTTTIYENLADALFKTDAGKWIHKVCNTIEEETDAIDAGYELVRAVNETKTIYRRRKMYGENPT